MEYNYFFGIWRQLHKWSKEPKAKHPSHTRQYSRPHQKYGTRTLINNQVKPKTNSKRTPAIYSGCFSRPGVTPWQIILEDMNCGTLFGGTQINLKFILTAAHCIDQFKKMPRKMCPQKYVKKVLPYPKNILSKYVLYFCCYIGKKSTYHNHRDNISPFLYW